jgi:hypothetical protein
MKNLQLIITEITTLENTRFSNDREHNRAKTRVVFLRAVRSYLETTPDAEYLQKKISQKKKELDKLSKLVEWPEKMNKSDLTKFVKSQEDKLGIPHLKKQIQVLKFIIE